MNKLYLILILVTYASTGTAQTLITYGNNTVSTSEFLRAYHKNKTPVADKEKELKEYINLYTNFKLKVQAASELRLDTLQQIKTDVENFRNQVEENYMSDENEKNALLTEAINRSFKELNIEHFYVRVDSTPADTLKSLQAINATHEELQKGNIDYKELIKNINSRYAPVKYNNVGFVSVFSLPYQFENIIYSLKTGESSKPFRTKNAWHIFKLTEERGNTGKWKIAQILFSLQPAASNQDIQLLKNRADSVYKKLISGADFSSMAKEFSEDKLTYLTGGEMPEFTSGKFDQSFEKQVMELKSDGDISKPFLTPFGIHIVKRLGHTPSAKDKNDPVLQYDIKQRILKDARIDALKEKFTKEIAGKIGFKKTNDVKETDLMRYADSIMLRPVTDNALLFPISNKQIIKFNKGGLKGSDWLKFVLEYKTNFEEYKGESNQELWNKYLVFATNEYYKNNLENYNEDFKYQMKEFKEGNMLFEIMERNVWGLANSDSAGLLKHYNENKPKYIWPESAEVLILNCTNEKSAQDVMEKLKKGISWKQLADSVKISVQVDSGRYELSQLIATEQTTRPSENSYSSIVKNSDGTATFIKYLVIYPAGQQRNFEEAKGLVINDYQIVLEEKWLSVLRKKYPVKINNSAYREIINK